jgi:hypothetical protein
VSSKSGGGSRSKRDDKRDDRGEKRERSRRGRGRSSDRGERASSESEAPSQAPDTADDGGDPLRAAYGVLTTALEALRDDGRHPVRDSDVKRRMLEVREGFDEGELGFPKFSRFLQQAADDGVVGLEKQDGGNYEVSLLDGAAGAVEAPAAPEAEEPEAEPTAESDATPEPEAEEAPRGPVVRELRPEDVVDPDAPGRRLGPRGGTTRRRGGDDDPPPLLPGQSGGAEESGAASETDAAAGGGDAGAPADSDGANVDVRELGLPTDSTAQLRYLTNSYKGVGKKTADALVESFGEDLFAVLHTQPDRVRSVVPAGRAEALLEAWREDFARRTTGGGGAPGGNDEGNSRGGGRGRGRRGRRGRGGRNG